MILNLMGISSAGCIIKRGLWKIRHIEQNRKLIKDEAWKDIHMTVPRRIVVLTIKSMICYIIYAGISFFESVMMHFGYLSEVSGNSCKFNI